MPKLLLVLPQNPRDPASGAALSLWTMTRWLAQDGWEILALGLSGNDGGSSLAGSPLTYHTTSDGSRWREEVADGVSLATLTATPRPGALLRRAVETMASFRPDLLLTYGDQPDTLALLQAARAAGVFSVFGLRNHFYLKPLPPAAADVCLAPSRTTRDLYRKRFGLNILALPPALSPENLIAPARDPITFGFVNPSFLKGGLWMAVLLRELATFRPALPVQITAGRGSFRAWAEESARHGCPLEDWPNVFTRELAAHPAELFQHTRALLFPSFNEAAGRVVLEALANGVPPILFPGGAPAELAAQAAILPDAAADWNGDLPSPARVRPWLEVMARLAEDETWLAERSAAATRRAEVFKSCRVGPAYRVFFESCLARKPEADQNFW